MSAHTLSKHEIEVLREDLLGLSGWLEDGKIRLNVLCDMAIDGLAARIAPPEAVAIKAIYDHNEGCELACAAQRPNERQSGGCGWQRHDGARVYSKRCPSCPLDWKIELPSSPQPSPQEGKS